ncbi:hypothetical protein [Bradyrhizobium sp. CCBAU 51753]|uniref:hypothetical protein n=1 Tax=Bradyrhizobium sp. CCBAU 51753 TaxID=1325100 RepID=UPI00188C103E|nr:hypothetical protein [Bradyrhizobium sp. CCBAU 51753]
MSLKTVHRLTDVDLVGGGMGQTFAPGQRPTNSGPSFYAKSGGSGSHKGFRRLSIFKGHSDKRLSIPSLTSK